jgi:two-component system, NtrC family, nitrogen regulation sensor histidine kinase NtrY
LIQFFINVLKRNAYFILAAAWLFTISFIIGKYWAGSISPASLKKSIETDLQKKENAFEKLKQDTALLYKLAAGSFSEEEAGAFYQKPYSIFIYQLFDYAEPALVYWNSQDALVGNNILLSRERNALIKLSNGYYEYIKETIILRNEKKYTLLVLVPVKREYFIENNNLKKEFVANNDAQKRMNLTFYETDYPVKSMYGQTLFYLQPKQYINNVNNNGLILTLTLAGIILVLLFIHNIAQAIADRYDYFIGIGFLIFTVAFLRALTYIFPSLINARQYELFDPSIYSSNFILSSLGDLLINSFLICWIVLFTRKVLENKNLNKYKDTRWHWWLACLCLYILLSVTLLFAKIIQSLIADAQISFNVTNFFSLDAFSFIGFLVLVTLSMSYFFFSQITIKIVKPLLEDKQWLMYVIITIEALILLSIIKQPALVELGIYMLIWLLAYVWLIQQKFISGLKDKLNISEILFWIFIFSLSVSIIIIKENNKIELEQRKRTAEKLSLQADPSSERLLSIALTYFDNDFLLPNFNRFKIAAPNQYLKDSLINKNFSAYINKYDTRIYTFDTDEKSLFNEDPISYDTLNTIFSIEGKPTNVNDLRYYERSFDKFSYISKRTVIDPSNKVIGYLFVLSEPKRYKNDALVPELFKQKRDYLPNEYSPIYSYAIYNDGELIDYYNDYQFPTSINISKLPRTEFTHRARNNYDEMWYRDNNKLVIIAKTNNYGIEAITLFSYLFTTFLLIVAVFRTIALLVQSGMRWKNLKKFGEFNLRSQIHGTIIFISLFSFIVIGIATIIFFINRYNKNKQDRLSKTIQIVSREMENRLQNHEVLDDMVRLYESGANDDLESMIERVAEIHGSDINVYDLAGNLNISSNPLIYKKGILSEKMNPIAYYNMHNLRLVQYVNEEQMGGVTYQSVYCPVRDEKGNAYAYLNIPSFDSQAELKREIANFLVTIINLNAFTFLIAGIIALMITNRITSYFSLIGNKMKEINLGKRNEVIEWKRDDEIGGLVTEYNKMVKKLEDSAVALAKSEREGAWREMARQVAHEIKNPLTPMKLSIQYLQKAIDTGSGDVKQLSSNVARTLVEQIDHLSKIASDFSQFANIGNVKNSLFDLHEILYSLSLLYQPTENLHFHWNSLPQRIMIMADKTQMNRLFTNLLQNAVEACEDKMYKVIRMDEMLENDAVIIKITDNGNGIPASTQSKIFTPNFTTKTSGTGLGLAMSRSIVEQAKGNIWFETTESLGTTFFIQLPIVRAI